MPPRSAAYTVGKGNTVSVSLAHMPNDSSSRNSSLYTLCSCSLHSEEMRAGSEAPLLPMKQFQAPAETTVMPSRGTSSAQESLPPELWGIQWAHIGIHQLLRPGGPALVDKGRGLTIVCPMPFLQSDGDTCPTFSWPIILFNLMFRWPPPRAASKLQAY